MAGKADLNKYMIEIARVSEAAVKVTQRTEIDIECSICTHDIRTIEVNYRNRNTELMMNNECRYCPSCGRLLK